MQEKIKRIKVERLSDEINVQCSQNKCPKNASYKFCNKYYCWYHRIDLNINNNLTL